MNNAAGAQARREEETAFLVVEGALGVVIELNDAGGGDGAPDGRWVHRGRLAVIEVTSPPASEVVRAFVEAVKAGERHHETGIVPAHLGTLHEHLTELVSCVLVKDVEKLLSVEADERHLYLMARTLPDSEYFARTSDVYEGGRREEIGWLELPEGITDVWFEGRARRELDPVEGVTISVAHFNVAAGWTRAEVLIPESALPAPQVVADWPPKGGRSPKDRTGSDDPSRMDGATPLGHT